MMRRGEVGVLESGPEPGTSVRSKRTKYTASCLPDWLFLKAENASRRVKARGHLARSANDWLIWRLRQGKSDEVMESPHRVESRCMSQSLKLVLDSWRSAGGEAEKETTRISVGAYGVCTHNMTLVVDRLCPEQCALSRSVARTASSNSSLKKRRRQGRCKATSNAVNK